MTMKLESLTNEVILDLFDHLSIGQMIRSFRALNSRFNQLTFIYPQTTRRLDLRFMSLSDSNIFFQSELSRIVNQINSITVSNDDETPLQIEFFRSDNFRFRQFINLQSLSLYHIHSQKVMMEIALEWDYLPHLTEINLTDCCFSPYDHVFNKIWNMPKLIQCKLSTRSCKNGQWLLPSEISSSLKYVSIQNFSNDYCLLINLPEFTPHLRCLYVHSNFKGIYTAMQLFSSLVKFEFNEICSSTPVISKGTDQLEILLQKMPNLYHLSIESLSMFMDGHQWENVITNYLPKLKIFRCKMGIHLNTVYDIEKRMNDLICSFQSRFWLKNNKWFLHRFECYH
jgi:hypothetical protein